MNQAARVLHRHARRVLRKSELNACQVKALWRDRVVVADPEMECDTDGSDGVTHEAEFRALVHYVSPAAMGTQRFQEIETGDVILDYEPGAFDPDGKADVRFEIAGVQYVQKSTGRELVRAWDVRLGGDEIMKTLLLRPQS